MRRILALLLLALCAPQALAAYAFVEQTTVNSNAATTNTRSITMAAGNVLVCFVGNRTSGTAPTDISDDVNGAWNLANGRFNGHAGAGVGQGIYYFPNAGAGATTVTVTFGASVTSLFKCAEFSTDTPAGVTLETSNDNDNTAATTHSHGAITTAGAGLLLTGGTASSSMTETVGTGFTALSDDGLRMWTQYQVTSGAYNATPDFTTSAGGDTACVVLALAESGGGGGGNAPRSIHYLKMRRR